MIHASGVPSMGDIFMAKFYLEFGLLIVGPGYGFLILFLIQLIFGAGSVGVDFCKLCTNFFSMCIENLQEPIFIVNIIVLYDYTIVS